MRALCYLDFIDRGLLTSSPAPRSLALVLLLDVRMFYEADAAARALRDGKKEVDNCRLEEDSLVMMKIMDEVRVKGGFKYSDEVEAVRSDA